MKMTKRQIQAVETRRKIYESTIRLFANKPYDSITIADICKEADISVGIFYYYFESKQAVLNEGFRMISDTFMEKTKDISLSPLEKIFYSIQIYMEVVKSRGYLFMSVILHHEILQIIPYKNNPDRTMYSYILNSAKEAFDSGELKNGDPEIVTSDIYRVLKGTIYDWILSRGEFSILDEVFRMVRIILEPYKPK